MRTLLTLLLIGVIASSCAVQKNSTNEDSIWELTFSDEFTTEGNFDTNKWSYAKRSRPSWAKFLTPSNDYVKQQSGNLILRMDNAKIEGDTIPYHSGGIQTSGKFNFTYGKVEVRAKFTGGQGSWPAIWMMPENPASYGSWPNSGEIDIMEHVNNENTVHQTIHNEAVTSTSGGSTATQTSAYNANGYNTFSIIWDPKKIEFYVNDSLQYTYSKPANATAAEWPFDKPFYIILNQSGGAGWPGPIVDEDLPFEMHVDYVRVFKKR